MIALLITGVSCIAFWAGMEIGQGFTSYRQRAEWYQKGYDDAKDFYRGMAKQRVTGDISIKKQQLN